MDARPDPQDKKDLDLMRNLADDPQAMREIYEAYAPHVFRYALSVLGNTQAADEVLQETMIAVWRNASGFKQASRASTWVYSICHNKIADYVRKEVRSGGDGSNGEGDVWAPSRTLANPGSSGLSDPRFSKVEFWEAFSDLSREQQEAILLFYDRGFSVAEVSEILGVPEGTVRSRLYLGKRKLREALGKP